MITAVKSIPTLALSKLLINSQLRARPLVHTRPTHRTCLALLTKSRLRWSIKFPPRLCSRGKTCMSRTCTPRFRSTASVMRIERSALSYKCLKTSSHRRTSSLKTCIEQLSHKQSLWAPRAHSSSRCSIQSSNHSLLTWQCSQAWAQLRKALTLSTRRITTRHHCQISSSMLMPSSWLTVISAQSGSKAVSWTSGIWRLIRSSDLLRWLRLISCLSKAKPTALSASDCASSLSK